jgi:polyisoprenyl-teichoic acid--peptidoglycan teichoic acid transferase
MRRRGAGRAFGGRLLIALTIATAAMIAAVAAVNYVIDVKLASAKRVHVHTAGSSAGPTNFLVLGADSQALDNLSDTMWVVRVDPGRKHALVVSFPRDLWVHVAGQQDLAKINVANNSGPQGVIDTMKLDFGININHYVQVDYKSFRGVVDAIGVVPVYLPYPARDDKSGFYSPLAGCKEFTGYDALQFVRSRGLSYYSQPHQSWVSADAVPDIDRIARQQDFVRQLGTLAASKAKSNPFTANAIVNRVLENLTIDSGLSRSDVLTIVDTFLGVSPRDTRHVQFETIPSAEGPNQNGEAVLFLKQPEAGPMIAELGGAGIGNNPSVSGGTLSSGSTSSSTSGSSTSGSSSAGSSTGAGTNGGGGSSSGSSSGVTTSGGGPAISGQLHATIANQGELGPPAPRSAPC